MWAQLPRVALHFGLSAAALRWPTCTVIHCWHNQYNIPTGRKHCLKSYSVRALRGKRKQYIQWEVDTECFPEIFIVCKEKCLHFSAAIRWIRLEILIHNGWYHELSFLLFCSSAWFQCAKDKKKYPTICHSGVGILTLWKYETKWNIISMKRKQSIWEELFLLCSA